MSKTEPYSKDQIQEEWTRGSYPVLARSFLGAAAALVEAAEIEPGERVLDVACGTGNVAITAYRREANVTGVDIAPAMLQMAREQAAVIDADIDWREGDATALPFDDDASDVTLSCLGHMFAHDQEAAATELLRVTRSGGRIAFVAWTPKGGIATMMKTLSEYLPPEPEPSSPPFLWGDPDTVRHRFGDRVTELHFETGVVRYPALSPAHFWNSMTTDSGAISLMLEAIDEKEVSSLNEEETETLAPYFSDVDNAMKLEYLLVTAAVQ